MPVNFDSSSKTSPSSGALQPEMKPAQEQKQEQKQEVKPNSTPAQPPASKEAPTLARPSTFVLPASVTQVLKKEAVSPAYLEMVEHLESLIKEQMAQVQEVMEAQGLKPGDIKLVYALDITGKEIQVCLACGVIGHDYMPTMVRQQNPEINMLTESVVVFLEVASRMGIDHGMLAYDDKGVLVLREVKPASNSADRANIVKHFDSFRQRHEIRDVTDRSWMEAEMAKWQPEWANRKMAGEALDEPALNISRKLLAKAGGGAVCGVTVAKSEAPTTSLRGTEAKLRAGSPPVRVSSIAVGKESANVARSMPGKVAIAPTMHQLRTSIGAGIRNLLGAAGL